MQRLLASRVLILLIRVLTLLLRVHLFLLLLLILLELDLFPLYLVYPSLQLSILYGRRAKRRGIRFLRGAELAERPAVIRGRHHVLQLLFFELSHCCLLLGRLLRTRLHVQAAAAAAAFLTAHPDIQRCRLSRRNMSMIAGNRLRWQATSHGLVARVRSRYRCLLLATLDSSLLAGRHSQQSLNALCALVVRIVALLVVILIGSLFRSLLEVPLQLERSQLLLLLLRSVR